MNDPFDQQITESLQRNADHAALPRPSFGDVCRRVRLRRQRNVVAMAAPAVLGIAALGLRAGDGAEPGLAGATTDTGPGLSVVVPVDGTWVGSASTLPADFFGQVACVDASGSGLAVGPKCQELFGEGPSFVSPSLSAESFVMAVDPSHASDAEGVAGYLGVDVRPLTDPYISDQLAADLGGVGVIVVIGQANPPSTIPTSATSVPVPLADDASLHADIARRVELAQPALAALGFPNNEYATDTDGVTTLSASDPTRPTERTVTMTMRRGVPEVTPTTSGTSETSSKVSFKFQANDGWIYTVEVDDKSGAALPTEAQLLDLQHVFDV
jgi:hypothetical protein